MDGFEDNRGIVVLGATNRPGAIDSALIRPGRFDRIIYMPLPDTEGRAKILQVGGRFRAAAASMHACSTCPCTGLCAAPCACACVARAMHAIHAPNMRRARPPPSLGPCAQQGRRPHHQLDRGRARHGRLHGRR